jgi:hypothetical protein
MVEKVLAHTVADKVKTAYGRGDLFEKTPSAHGRLGAVLRLTSCQGGRRQHLADSPGEGVMSKRFCCGGREDDRLAIAAPPPQAAAECRARPSS